MATVPCGACGKPMNAESVVCPHCGVRRSDAKPGIAGKLSQDEIRALLVTESATREKPPSDGILATLLLPHPQTTGAAHTVELALTIACFPIVLAGSSVVMFSRRSRGRTPDDTTGELSPVLIMSLLGAPTLLTIFGLTPLGFLFAGGSVLGLAVRGVIRSRAATKSNRELTRLAAPEKR